jgi:hypothetical protein
MGYNLRKPETQQSIKDEIRYGKGNIDLYDRPVVLNDNGSISTVRSMSFYDKLSGKEVVVPTVADDGRIMNDEEAKQNYYNTGKYLAVFDTVKEAKAFAENLHNEQDKIYQNVPRGLFGRF